MGYELAPEFFMHIKCLIKCLTDDCLDFFAFRDDLCIINDGAIQWVQRDSEDSKVPENFVLYWILLLCNGCELCLY